MASGSTGSIDAGPRGRRPEQRQESRRTLSTPSGPNGTPRRVTIEPRRGTEGSCPRAYVRGCRSPGEEDPLSGPGFVVSELDAIVARRTARGSSAPSSRRRPSLHRSGSTGRRCSGRSGTHLTTDSEPVRFPTRGHPWPAGRRVARGRDRTRGGAARVDPVRQPASCGMSDCRLLARVPAQVVSQTEAGLPTRAPRPHARRRSPGGPSHRGERSQSSRRRPGTRSTRRRATRSRRGSTDRARA
jgi:hypothetical protein